MTGITSAELDAALLMRTDSSDNDEQICTTLGLPVTGPNSNIAGSLEPATAPQVTHRQCNDFRYTQRGEARRLPDAGT
ncbi:hypothetical protein FDW83_09710 [Pseudarthrobacter sp. NamE2]|uniref:hypothetical protein n=1 Tax=Pseudarthrobacter sp. NamE2 TaxID=2576838 RepID=UPI0010FE8C79|nr:hypothetical protein [Pseudarthrobacter sp. NamE2]TLM83713.1 hypothetical protein FDW83_09710 [Pseudarthrobacter sp. NamE2]